MADLAGAYRDARASLEGLLLSKADDALDAKVPACPEWSIKDTVAHVTGVAEGIVSGAFPEGAEDAWRDDERAARRDAWTARQVESRRGRSIRELFDEWNKHSEQLEPVLAGTAPLPPGTNPLATPSAVMDLAVHAQDIRGALGEPGDRDSGATKIGFRAYLIWLGTRLAASNLPPLRVRAGEREFTTGEGEPGGTLAGDFFELFRLLSGRRTREQARALLVEGDAAAYLPLLTPYSWPAQPLEE